jgi:hypothetical protein
MRTPIPLRAYDEHEIWVGERRIFGAGEWSGLDRYDDELQAIRHRHDTCSSPR